MAGRDGGWLARAQAGVQKLWSGQQGRVRAAGRRRHVQAMPTAQYRPAPVEQWSQRRQLGHYSRPARRGGGDHNATTLVIIIIVVALGLGLLYAVSSWLNAGAVSRNGSPTPAPAVASPTVSPPISAPVSSPAALPSPQGVVLGTPGTVVIQGAAPTPEPPPGARRTHRVAQGDTLARIAQQYGTTVDAIMRANNFTDRGRILRVGEELVIPAP
ncbi:MAG: LysM peptidoglycan-binding domain-containing protein [Chloroflexota bacterium]